MAFKEILTTYSEIQRKISSNDKISLFYFTGKNCGVCSVVKPGVSKMLEHYPQISGYQVSIDEDPMISGQLSVYVLPLILVYYQRRELLREGKFIVIDQLEPKLERLLENFGMSDPR